MRAYFSLDPRSLAAFRIGLGLLLLADLAERALELEAHYTDFGVLPRAALTTLAAHPVYSLHMLSGDFGFQAALFAVSAASSVLLVLGLFTRWATAVAYVMLFSVQNRNPIINHGQDDLERMLLTWALFLPLGAAWSWDARRRGAAATASVCSFATVALTLQPLMVYLVITVSKFQYSSWLEGRAVYSLLRKAHYVRPLGEFALTIPGFTTFATYSTIVTEFAFILLLASPWQRSRLRTLGVAIGAVFHATLFAMVDVGLFQPLAVLTTVALLPSELWDRFQWARRDTRAPASATIPLPHPWGRSGNLLCGGLLLCAVISVPPSLLRDRVSYPEPLASVYRVLKLEQRFRMFANMDVTPQGWWLATGTLGDGRLVNAIEPGEPVHLARPEHYAERLPNDNWRIYWSTISRPESGPFRAYLAEYFCRRWNRAVRSEDRMHAIEIIHVKERATHPDRPASLKPVTLIRGPCPDA